MAKLDRDALMTIKTLTNTGVSNRETARLLGVTEGTVRYHLKRQTEGAVDGRSNQQHRAATYRRAIDAYLDATRQETPTNVRALFEYLVAEHDYPGSLRGLQRYVKTAFPPPPKRARRRIETPPGAQAQADWAHFPSVLVAGRNIDLVAFCLQLSYSRADALVWSTSKAQLAWLSSHNEALKRLGGVPAVIRVDNEKTAVARGAGSWGELNATYARYARTVRFHIDACQPRSPEAKGKIERRIRDQRRGCDPYQRHWNDLHELQAWTDERVALGWKRRTCPATGTSVQKAHATELRSLAPLPELPEPFDVAFTRTVAADCTVQFEGRSYSVPFGLVGQQVEVRGCATSVQVLHEARIVATHPRHTRERIILDPQHFEGEATPEVLPPQPLGRMGQRLEEIRAMTPETRPLDLYAALVEGTA